MANSDYEHDIEKEQEELKDDEIDVEIAPDRTRKLRRGVYLLPNLITSASLFGGFYSIVAALDGNFVHSAVAILISAVLDCMDGRVARLTNTTSKFGMEYDSLSDLVAFGLAPGILVFTWALRPFEKFGWLAAFLYVVCGALRLARFNVQTATIGSKHFNGLPIPAAAVLVASTVIFFNYLGQIEIAKHVTVLVMIYTLAFLMVSTVKYYSFKEFNIKKRSPFRLLVGVILLAVLVAAQHEILLLVLTFGYVASGPVYTLIDMMKNGHKLEINGQAVHKGSGEHKG
ncbi:MAG: CDP-diacylglycerol--serine O-phosphatidyltransferase [Deltaproteobacteria bacterium]|nr:CDP-diacylglycerol--serine O-phosphatidyltransferase [Deltaproteobacteria bacterium]